MTQSNNLSSYFIIGFKILDVVYVGIVKRHENCVQGLGVMGKKSSVFFWGVTLLGHRKEENELMFTSVLQCEKKSCLMPPVITLRIVLWCSGW